MPKIAELRKIDGAIWARVEMEMGGSSLQILSEAEIEAQQNREMHQFAEIERLRKEHDDLLTQALGVEAEREIAKDEVERLTKERDAALGNADMNYQKWVEAQAKIERLHAVIENEVIVSRDAMAEIKRLQAALNTIAERSLNDPECPAYEFGHIAERALANEQNVTGE